MPHGYQGSGSADRPDSTPRCRIRFDTSAVCRAKCQPTQKESCSDQELTEIYAYVKSFPPPKPVKDIPLLKNIKDRQ
jgi:hypothetical protein